MRWIKRGGSLFLAVLFLLLLMPFTAFAGESRMAGDKRVVRVAYPEQKYLTEIDENGSYYGYSYEYLKKVAEFANWDLRYITYPNQSLNEQIVNGMDMVAAGQADLIGVMLRNEALEKQYLYPEKNYGVVYTTLDALDSNFRVNETNYMRKDPLRIAVLKQAKTRNEELVAFTANAKLSCEYIECDTVEEQLEALKNGSADVLVKVSLTFLPDLKEIAAFAPRPYYFASGLGNEELIGELDEAITKINITDPYFESRLQSKYFQNTTADFALSDAEKKYVAQNRELEVLLLPQYAPFAFINKENELCGMSVSILDEIGEKAGIKFKYHMLHEGESMTEHIASGQYSVVLGPPHSDSFAECNGLVLSQPYLEASLTMFMNKFAQSKPKNTCVLGLLRDVADPIEYEYKEIRYYNTIEECLEGVNQGEADYGYGTQHVIDFYTTQNSYKNLTYLNLSGYNREVGFFVPNTEEMELLSIINKYLRSMPTKDVHRHLSLALSQKDTGGLQALIQDNPILVVAITVLFLFLLLLTGTLAVYNRVNHKRNEKLQQAFAAKSDFLSRMSHDMRTPMNGIIGLTGLSLDIPGLPQEALDNLEKIDESAQYLLSLINDTLDMNKIESSKIVLNQEPTDLQAFFVQMMGVIRVSADQKNVKFVSTHSDEALPIVYLDKVRVQQILFNVVSNAIKFTPENGTVEVHGTCTLPSPDRVHATLRIKDTGIGIAPEFLPKIFEPFEQEYNLATSNYTGTGLGLAIVKNLVELMGGSISVTSEKGVGTQFLIEIEFDVADAREITETPTAIEQDTLAGKRVLLCEDHPLNAQIATKLLEKKGLLVEYAENGQVAVQLFEQSEPGYYDAVLMDIRMPVMDGLTATKIMRGMDRADAKKIPILAMTANAFDEDVQKSKAAGMSAHLAKPIEPKKLYEALCAFLLSGKKSS